jgi:hypothetical protein
MPRAGGCKLIAQKEALLLLWRVSFCGAFLSAELAATSPDFTLGTDYDWIATAGQNLSGLLPVAGRCSGAPGLNLPRFQ